MSVTRLALADRVRRSLALPAPPGLQHGDLDDCPPTGTAVEAAVLIAITDRPEPGLILTVRRENLRRHAGQVAFPGGRLDPGEDSRTAALREAEEELGLPAALVDVWGSTDVYRTVTGYRVTPIVGLVPPDLALAPHEPEVADWFEVPLSFVLSSANHRRMSADYQGKVRHYWQIDWNERPIWGATAAMLVNLALRTNSA